MERCIVDPGSLCSGIPPSLPGRVDVFKYVCALALKSYGIDPATALSYGILLHVIVYIPVIAGGLPSLWVLPVGQARQPG
jgi:hypothetical protein